MAGDKHGAESQEEPQTAQDNGREQAAQGQPQVSGTDWEKVVTERDEKIAVDWLHLFGRNREGLFSELDWAHVA